MARHFSEEEARRIFARAAERQRRVEQVRTIGAGIVVGAVEDVESVAAADAALEVEVVAEDPDDILDGRPRQVVARGRLVQALVQARPGAGILVLVLAGLRLRLRLG